MNLKHDHLTRQLDLINPDLQNKPITIIGAGSIGSFLALNLAKCGWTDITVYDFDTVSVENMSNQFFRFSDIGKNKVDALSDLVFDFTQVRIKAVNQRLIGDELQGSKGILFYCVDSMQARAGLTQFLGLSFFDLVIDLRMSSEFLAIYSFKPSNTTSYKNTLYADAESVAERCTAKSTIYTATLAAAMAVKVLKNFTCSENFIKFFQWDIKSNENFVSFSHEKN